MAGATREAAMTGGANKLLVDYPRFISILYTHRVTILKQKEKFPLQSGRPFPSPRGRCDAPASALWVPTVFYVRL